MNDLLRDLAPISAAASESGTLVPDTSAPVDALAIGPDGSPIDAAAGLYFDEVGNLNWTRDPRWKVTTFGYDQRNRKIWLNLGAAGFDGGDAALKWIEQVAPSVSPALTAAIMGAAQPVRRAGGRFAPEQRRHPVRRGGSGAGARRAGRDVGGLSASSHDGRSEQPRRA